MAGTILMCALLTIFVHLRDPRVAHI